MNAPIKFLLNNAVEENIVEHLRACDADFVPPLSTKVDVLKYAHKLVSSAIRFEAWAAGRMVGLVAVYCNDQENGIAYISNVSVLREWTRKGIAKKLIKLCIEHVASLGLMQIRLEVTESNFPAVNLYEQIGFVEMNANPPLVVMEMFLKS